MRLDCINAPSDPLKPAGELTDYNVPGASYPDSKGCFASVNSDKPFISVVIPAFDEERYLSFGK
jgi:hypothetical protein